MNIYLPGYSFGNRMCVVIRNKNTFNEFVQRGTDVMYICEDVIHFMPDNCDYSTDQVKADRLQMLKEFDIVEISETGLLYRAFANNEADTTIFLGARCNSNCIMCPASDAERKKGFSYSREVLINYIRLLPSDLEYLVLTGGEPTMQPDLFIEVLEQVKDKFQNSQILLLTNGRSLSDEWFFRQVIDHQPNNFRIAIPIHAASPDLHDAVTRSKGSFNQTILGLTRLMNSDIKVEIRIVITKANCDDLMNIAHLISREFRNVYCVNFIGLEPRGNCALNFKTVYLDHKTSFFKSKSTIEYLISCGYDVGLYNFPLCAIDRDFWPIASKSISKYKNVYHSNCDNCSVKTICGGFFTADMSIAKPKVFPISSKETSNE